MVQRIFTKLRSSGLRPLLRRGVDKLLAPRFECYAGSEPLFEGRSGVEVGGPSRVFQRRGLFPVYPLATRLDNCNFGARTLWEGSLAEGVHFKYDAARAPGRQFLAEATHLVFAQDGTYDFLLSSHMLEHTANPLLALREWKRVLRPGGAIFLILPHRQGTFDHRRPVTPLSHLLEDLERGTDENDLTHLQEILELHDLQRDPEAGTVDEFRARSLRNAENRSLHQHVFDTRLAVQVVDVSGFQIRAVETALPFHIAILAARCAESERADNDRFLDEHADFLRSSRFTSDRPGQ